VKPDGGLHPDACPDCYTDRQPGFEQPHERDCPRRVLTDAELDAERYAERMTRPPAGRRPTRWR